LSEFDAACGVIILALYLRMYESALHQRKVKRKTTTHTLTTTPKSHKRYRVEKKKNNTKSFAAAMSTL
jgi:hypothetical protein